MTLDWFTVVAQIINFVVLVFLLYRLLYGPVVKAMRQREERIATQLREAEAIRQQAAEEAATYRQKNVEFDQRRGEMLSAMQEDVDAQEKEMLAQARSAVTGLHDQWAGVLRRERAKFADELARKTSVEVFSIARRALVDIADTALEEHAARIFLRRIQTLDSDAWHAFKAGLPEMRQSIVVRTAFDLPDELRREIEQVLLNGCKAAPHSDERNIRVHFTTNPELIAGIELQAHSHIAAWNLRDYLQTLEERVASLLDAESESDHGGALDRYAG